MADRDRWPAPLVWALGSVAALTPGVLSVPWFFVLSPILATVSIVSFVRLRSRRSAKARLGLALAVISLVGTCLIVGATLHLIATVVNDPAWRR
jgi:hypothetical protein